MSTHGYLTANATTGKLLSIRFPTGPVPTDGISEDGLLRVITITDSNLPSQQCLDYNHFISNYYYNASTSAFVNVGAPPNDYATWNFTTNAWEWDANKVLEDIRLKRNGLLSFCDFAVLPDSPFTDAEITEIRTYRQTLRDFPSTVTGNPATASDVTWPTPPACLG